MKIKYMNLYKEGAKQFEERITSDMTTDEYDELLEDMSWGAYYNDAHHCKSDSEAYFIICEAMTEEEANDWMDERMTATIGGAA